MPRVLSTAGFFRWTAFASMLSLGEGLVAVPPSVELAAGARGIPMGVAVPKRRPRASSVLHRCSCAANVRSHSVALASFDFFQPVDDDLDDLYGGGDEATKRSRSTQTADDSEGDHCVHWLDPEMEGLKSLGEAIADGEAVVSLPGVVDFAECYDLAEAGLRARQLQGGTASRGRSRFSVSDPSAFDGTTVMMCEEILLRVLDYLDETLPSVYETLFRPGDEWLWRQPLDARGQEPSVPPPEHLAETCGSLRELYLAGELEWSEGEPAINVYESEGYFGCHKDHLALTVLIPLTSPDQEFAGGGTGYWRGNRMVDENPTTPPDLVLKPEKGTALLFGGDVTHSGMPVEAGFRSVLVCSFSTRTAASPPNRLHGLRAPPEVSANFKGTA